MKTKYQIFDAKIFSKSYRYNMDIELFNYFINRSVRVGDFKRPCRQFVCTSL